MSDKDIFTVDPKADKNASPGVQLDGMQGEYMLPHFIMLLVGKPGSGKTTLM